MKIRDNIIDYYAFLVTYIFLDWQESLEDCKGRVSVFAKPMIESIFVTYYKILCDPEKTLEGSTIDVISPQFQNCQITSRAEKSMLLLDGYNDINAAIDNVCQKLGQAATKNELDYIISNLHKLDIACSSSTMFIPSIQLSRIGTDIVGVLYHYKSQK